MSEKDIPGGPKTPNPEEHTNEAGVDKHLGDDSFSRSWRRQSQSSNLNTQVCVRVRPILQYEQEEGEGSIWRCERDKVIRKGSPGITYFHGPNVFGPEATNDRIFKRSVASCLDTLCKGKSCTIMAYGEETSGKTHNLMGSEEDGGIIWMSLVHIFKAAQQMRGVTGVAISYCEIFNEVLSDLLQVNGVSLPIREDPAEGFHVQGATVKNITTAKQGLELIRVAEDHRRFLMLRSDLRRCSRSTTVLRVILRTTAGDASAYFVDLASSGSWDSTTEGSSHVLGRAEGGVGVARSVVNLRSIVRGLGGSSGPQLHRPRLNSKLMKMLDHAVDGTSRVVFICTISPAQSREEGSIRTLHFATDASKIAHKPTMQEPVPSSFYQETEYTTAKPLFRVRSQIDALWEELVPFCKLCSVTSNLPVPTQLLLEMLNSSAMKIKTLETEMGDLRNQILPALHGDRPRLGARRSSSFPSLADTEKLQAMMAEQGGVSRGPSSGTPTSAAGGPSGLPPSGRGLRRSKTEKAVGATEEKEKQKKGGDFGSRMAMRGRAREEAMQRLNEQRERRASSTGRNEKGEDTPARQVWRRMWEVAEDASARLEMCNQKLAAARQATGLTSTSNMARQASNMGRLGGTFGQNIRPGEAARRKHDDWRAQVEKLKEELKIMNQRVGIVGNMPVVTERMQQLSGMEKELESKKRRVIDRAIEAQEEAVTRLLNLRRSSSSDEVVVMSEPAAVTGANDAVTGGEAGVPSSETPDGDGDGDGEEAFADTEHVAASQGPESGGDAGERLALGLLEEVPEASVAKPAAPLSQGSAGDLRAPPPGGWPQVSQEQRRALRQSRDKPWMTGSTRSIKSQLRQAVSDSRAGEDEPGGSTRPSSAGTSVSNRDVSEGASEGPASSAASAAASSAASAAPTERKKVRNVRARERPWRAPPPGQHEAVAEWEKVRTAVKGGDKELLDGRKEGGEERDSAHGGTQESAKSEESDGDGPAAGKDFGEELRIAASAAVEFPAEWSSAENVQWGAWVRWVLYGEEYQRSGPPPEASQERVQATLEDLWQPEILTVESLCLKCLIAIEKVGEEVMARQRDGSFETNELLWELPKLTPLENHVVTVFGDNRFGQLGGGTASGEGQTPSEVPREIYQGQQPLSAASSWRNTVIVTDKHQIVQLGVRDMTQGSLEGKPQRGARVIQSQVTSFPVPGHQIMAVACGWQHSMALSGAGAVFSWGYGGYGALGHGNMYSSMKPVLVEGLLGQLVQSIACGSYSSTAITSTGHLFTWGWGLGGQLGHGTRNNQMLPLLVEQDCHGEPLQPLRKVACGHQHIVALTRAGRLFSAGLGKNGRLGFSSILEETRFRRVERTSMNEEVLWIQDVCAGFGHTAVLDTNGRVLTCGEGGTGALGHGTPLQDCFFLKIVESLPRALFIACGGFFTVVATEDKAIWTWGRNDYRQLGRKCFFRWEPQRKAVGRFQGVGEEKLADAIRLGIQDLQSATSIPDPLAIEDAYPSQATDVSAVNIPGAGAMIALDAGHSHVSILTRQQKAYGLKPGESPRPPATFTMGISMKIAGSPDANKKKDKDRDAAALIEAVAASSPPAPAPADSPGSTPPDPSRRPASPLVQSAASRTSLPPIDAGPASRGTSPAPSPRPSRSRSASRERPRSLSREALPERPATASRGNLLAPLQPTPLAIAHPRQRGHDADPPSLSSSGPLRAPSREGRSPEANADKPRAFSASPEPAVPRRPGSGSGSRPGSRPSSRGLLVAGGAGAARLGSGKRM